MRQNVVQGEKHVRNQVRRENVTVAMRRTVKLILFGIFYRFKVEKQSKNTSDKKQLNWHSGLMDDPMRLYDGLGSLFQGQGDICTSLPNILLQSATRTPVNET